MEVKKEAIAINELILRRFPDDPNKPAIYYNLYRLYSDIDQAKSDFYKNKLLKEFPETPFAKIIADPNYAKKLEDANAEFTDAYNVVFDLYVHKQYKDVIARVPELLKQYPGNNLSAQLEYLQTIAAGHYEKIGPFRDSLQQIAKRFPTDRLITPLINKQLAYIDANSQEMLARNTVLPDEDPRDIPFTLSPDLKEKAAYMHQIRPPVLFASKPAEHLADKKQDGSTTQPLQPLKTAKPNKAAINNPDGTPSIFSMRDSSNYYFVINVATGTTNLASSRFGIGQFTRANFDGKGIKHQLMPVEADNQLIFVGRFSSIAAVKDYAGQIIPLLPDIMKVPQGEYSFFIITQENLDKLTTKKLLDSYIDYYQQNY